MNIIATFKLEFYFSGNNTFYSCCSKKKKDYESLIFMVIWYVFYVHDIGMLVYFI